MKHYIITGGAGFIGSRLIRELFRQQQDIRITCIDNFDPFYSADLKQLNIRDFKSNPGFHFLYYDLSRGTLEELCDFIPEPADVIVHLAAKAGVWPSVQNPSAYLESNILGLQNILEFARIKSIPQFVFGSSSSVYGINEHFPWKEEETPLPINPYAVSKQAGEMLGHVYSCLYGIRFIALRIFTVYGPSQRPDLAIHKFMKAILSGAPITVYGDGSASRDYTFVDDIVQGLVAAMKYEQTGFEIINIGNNVPVSLMELINELESVTGIKAEIEWKPDQPGDLLKTCADINKAKRLLNYNPKTKLNEGIAVFYEWFMEHKSIVMS